MTSRKRGQRRRGTQARNPVSATQIIEAATQEDRWIRNLKKQVVRYLAKYLDYVIKDGDLFPQIWPIRKLSDTK